MAIPDHGHFPWIVFLACWFVAGCQQTQPTDTTIESTNGGNTAAAPTSTSTSTSAGAGVVPSRGAGASAAASDGKKSPSEASSGTAPSTETATSAETAPSSAATPGAAGASGSGPASPDAAADTEGPDGDAATPNASAAAGACGVRPGTAAEAGFVGDWTPGTYPDNFSSTDAGNYLTIKGLPNQAGEDREYAVHVPLGYDKGAPLPALFCLHAFSMNARSFCDDMAGWLAKADKENFIVIMPNGYMNSFNIGEGCGAALLPVHTAGIDDVEFVRALLDEVGKHVNIDLGRVYATGFSNGSSLAWRLACEASDIFTAVVPVAAGSCLSPCKPSQKVSILDVYGAADAFNPTEDLAASMAAIQAVNGCSTTTMPAAVPMTTGASDCVTSMGCSSTECSAVEVTQCVVQNGSHCWYGDISTADCGAGEVDGEFAMTNLAWEFLRRLSR